MSPPRVLPQAYHQLDQLSRQRYGIPGDVLLAKLEKGESGGRANAVSDAGARRWFQFMPGTRDAVKSKFGLDPWRSEKEARDAAVLHLTGYLGNAKGLEGYNPGGGQSYVHYILGQKVGNVPTANTPGYTAQGSPAPASALPAPQASSALADVLARPVASVSQPLAPAFSAKVAQPAGYTAPPGVAAAQQPDLRSQLSEILKADAPPAYQPSAPPVTQGAGGPAAPRLPGVGTNYGRVIVAPGANRSGVALQRPVLGFVKEVAGIFGRPIQITTGTNHNEFVAGTHRESDHWQGNAVDVAVPVDGARGDQIAASALQAAGVSPKKAQQMARQGGLYNLDVNGRRLQVIWKTNEGGNHHNHVHIGYR